MRTGRVILLGSAVVAVGFAILAPQLLRLFGGEFGEGATALRILIVGEVAKIACGFGGLALVMTPFERSMTAGTALGIAVNIPLTAALFVARDAPNFMVVQGLLGIALIAAVVAVLALLGRRR